MNFHSACVLTCWPAQVGSRKLAGDAGLLELGRGQVIICSGHGGQSLSPGVESQFPLGTRRVVCSSGCVTAEEPRARGG